MRLCDCDGGVRLLLLFSIIYIMRDTNAMNFLTEPSRVYYYYYFDYHYYHR